MVPLTRTVCNFACVSPDHVILYGEEIPIVLCSLFTGLNNNCLTSFLWVFVCISMMWMVVVVVRSAVLVLCWNFISATKKKKKKPRFFFVCRLCVVKMTSVYIFSPPFVMFSEFWARGPKDHLVKHVLGWRLTSPMTGPPSVLAFVITFLAENIYFLFWFFIIPRASFIFWIRIMKVVIEQKMAPLRNQRLRQRTCGLKVPEH